MREMKKSMGSAMGAAVILALIAASAAFAAEPVRKGVDLWMTVAGFAKTSFAGEPIPAGFFCADSQAYTGTIVFKGRPLATEPARSLGDIDTVVRRLDDAVFNDKGQAATRIQLLALSLVSTKPVETSCGSYDVAVGLNGEQPTTTMRIFRTEAQGGTYSAPLALNVRLVFTPIAGDKSARRELTRRIDLGPANHSVWAYVQAPQYKGGVKIDTKGDGRPDTVLPASSNFLAGVEPAVLKGGQPSRPQFVSASSTSPSCPPGQCPYQACHCDPNATDPYHSSAGCDHLHCIWTCVASGGGTGTLATACANTVISSE